MTRIPLLKDDPARAAALDDGDLLGQGSALQTLLTAVESLQAPACVALYGSWGSGKSTLMRKARNAWVGSREDPTGRRAVWFDPWEHERSDDLLTPLLYAVLQAVKEERTVDPAEVKRLLGGIAKVVLAVSVRLGTALAFGGLAGETAGKLAALTRLEPEKLAELFSDHAALRDEVEEVKQQFKDLVDDVLKDRPGPLLFLLDDLDRCLPDTTVALIEAIKLLLCGDTACKAVFVFALDRQIVGEAIRQRYPGSSLYTGENYLEKIFDLSLEVPPVTVEQIEAFVRGLYAGQTESMERLFKAFRTADQDGLQRIASVLAEPCFANPRVIQRSLNRLMLLVQDDERLGRVRSMADPARYQKLIAWVAGAERFREFRSFFSASTDDEAAALHKLIVPNSKVRPVGELLRHPVIERIARQPEFLGYYDMLGLRGDREGDLQAARKPGGNLTTLRDIDDFLRAVGL